MRTLILILIAAAARGQSIRFPSDTLPVTDTRAREALRAVCQTPLAMAKQDGHTVATCLRLCPAHTDFTGNRENQYATGVTFGHFLAPNSDDAVISAQGCESHASGFGGSYLLEKAGGVWNVLWYRTSILTGDCHVVARRDGRQQLVCENGDMHQGIADRILYVEDLASPDIPGVNGILGVTDSTCGCCLGMNRPTIRAGMDRVQFTPAGLTIYAHFGQATLTREQVEKSRELAEKVYKDDCVHVDIPVTSYKIDFLFDGESYRVAPASRAAAKIFRVP